MATVDPQALVIARLVAGAVGVAGVTLFKGMRRESIPGPAIFVMATGGPPGQAHSHGDFDKLTVQLLTVGARGAAEAARVLAVAARDALHRQGWTDGTVTVLQAVVREPHPYPLASDDDNGAAFWTQNVELWVAP